MLSREKVNDQRHLKQLEYFVSLESEFKNDSECNSIQYSTEEGEFLGEKTSSRYFSCLTTYIYIVFFHKYLVFSV